MNRPAVAPAVIAELVDALAPRLKRRLEWAPRVADSWSWNTADGVWVVEASPEVSVYVRPDNGAVSSKEQLTCTCLLAPKCLHVVAVAIALPVQEGGAEAAGVDALEPASTESVELTPQQSEAAEAALRAGAAMLRAGAAAFGLVIEAELLRTAHSCRIVGLHRLSGALVRVVQRGREYRDQRPEFRLEALAADLYELLSTAWRLRRGPVDPRWVGTARRAYKPAGSLQLAGIFTEAIVSAAGFAGVVTYLCDSGGRIWSIADVAPGDADRCRQAYHAGVGVGELVFSHAELSRAGLRLQGMTASADRRLGAGRQVRAVATAGAAWSEPPLAALWAEPLPRQLDRVWASLELDVTERSAGSDLLFGAGSVAGVVGASLIVDSPAGQMECLPPSDHAELAYVDNLRLLGSCPGLKLRFVGRVRTGTPRSVRVLAIGADESEDAFAVPDEWRSRVNLGLDQLQRAQIRGATGRPLVLRKAQDVAPLPDPLDIVRRRLLQVVMGGAGAVAQPVWTAIEADERTLERAQLRTAAVLHRAIRAAMTRGRTEGGDADPLARAWTAMRDYERHASARLERLRWG